MSPKHIALGVLAAFIWGATFPWSAWALADTPPIFFTCLRFICAGAFVLVVPRPAISWRMLILVSLLMGCGQYGFLFLSMTHGIPAGLASLLVHSQAFFTIIIAMLFFGERLTGRQYLALGLALAGLCLLAINRFDAGAGLGLIFILLAALISAVGNNVLKTLGHVEMLGVVVWMSVIAPVPLFILSMIFELPAGGNVLDLLATVTWTTVGAIVYSAVLATIFVITIWGRLLVAYSTAMVAPFFLLVPVFGLSLSAWLLGDRFTPMQIGGGVLVFAGLILALWPRRGAGV